MAAVDGDERRDLASKGHKISRSVYPFFSEETIKRDLVKQFLTIELKQLFRWAGRQYSLVTEASSVLWLLVTILLVEKFNSMKTQPGQKFSFVTITPLQIWILVSLEDDFYFYQQILQVPGKGSYQ